MATKKTEELSTEQKVVNKVASFLVSKKTLVIICAAIVFAVIVGIVLGVSIADSKKTHAQERLAALEASYAEYIVSLDEELKATLIANAEKETKGKGYTAARSSYLIGQVYFESEEFDLAYDNFIAASEKAKDIFLAPLAIINAAVCKDQLGDSAAALELYTKASEYKESGVEPKALFNVARIYSEKGNTQLANSTLQQIIDNYSYSEYASIAKNILSAN